MAGSNQITTLLNPEDYSRDDLIAAGLATPWLAAALLLGLALWLFSLSPRKKLPTHGARVFAGVGGALLLSAVIWTALQLSARWVALATSWPLWVLAVIGGIAGEAIIGIYRLEREIVASVARGRLLLGLRLAALGILLIILAQPVRSFLIDKEINREVAILVDDSDSMALADQRLTPSEMLDRAELFGVSAAVPRPPMGRLARELDTVRDRLATERASYEGAPDAGSVLAARHETALLLTTDLETSTRATAESLRALANQAGLPGEAKTALEDLAARLGDHVVPALAEARGKAENREAEAYLEGITAAAAQIDDIAARLPTMREAIDGHFFQSLPETDRAAITEAAGRPREEIVRRLLAITPPAERTEEGQVADPTLLDSLGESYNLRYYRFARETRPFAEQNALIADDEGGDSDGTSTDLTGALEHILENTAPESLAGVLLLSDGRHNGARLAEDALRQLGTQNSPLSAIPIGGRLGPVDVSILSLTAPESVYLGDRVGVRAELKFDGLRGENVLVRLRHNGETVEEQTVTVPDVDHRAELRFVHLPETKGVYHYELEIEPLAAELFASNNRWSFKTAVTDDRTNVLLVDSYPRWEFRYLRNLFYGRDKSVHLQYVLLRPDRIDGFEREQRATASASRPFGEAEAERLPRELDEWRLFDVIILGDLPPGAISQEEWRAISESVTERGALLVCVGGPRYMPHAYDDGVLTELLPVTWEPSETPRFDSPEPAYRIALTTEGRGHPVMAQSTSRSLNAQLWARMPAATWRATLTGVKEDAEVLAFAEPVDGTRGAGSGVSLDGSPESVEKAIAQLANRKQYERERALVTVRRVGLGKVAMMSFDQTWRLRYGVGDTYHHRFWGQLLRWGAGENLRSGGERVRLGTDRITYTPSDPVRVMAKVLDADRRPVTDADLSAVLYREGEVALRQRLAYREGSSGIYETDLAALPEPGDYTVRLEGDLVDEALADAEGNPEGLRAIEAELVVVASRNPVELSELTADRDFLIHSAQASGGRVAEIGETEVLLTSFGAPRETLTERRNLTLWDKWPLLLAFLALLTTEWVLRRRSGLA